MRSHEDYGALEDANGRLLAALGRVGSRLNLATRVAVVEHRLAQPGVRDGRDPVGLAYALTEAVATLAEAVDQEFAEAAAVAEPTRKR